ncbi:MAG TPA: helix-turn-helix domain-containing protein [Dyella sp.]|uniref:Crp/Fnr family transcriptional regulator n=1 Tax=Dyella sp. TaxID=1869338 RepID=UPI002F943276
MNAVIQEHNSSSIHAAPVAKPVVRPAPGAGFDLDALRSHMLVQMHKLEAGKALYRAGQPFRSLFLVHAGFLKNTLVSEDGRERVTAFHMRGDVLGTEAIGTSMHVCSAVALDSSVVWEVPYTCLLRAGAADPSLQARLADILAAEMRNDRRWMLAQSTLGAEQRVASFLLHMAARHEDLGFSGRRFMLRMSRMDIASFLALKHETVTRALSHLADLGCIRIQLRDVQITDPSRLEQLSQQNERIH